MKKRLLAGVAMAFLSVPMAANAAIISGTFNWNASGFVAPFTDPLFGAFTIAFDNGTDIVDSQDGLSAATVNRAIGSSIGYTYFKNTDSLVVGGLANGANGVTALTDDFFVGVSNISTSPSFSSSGQSVSVSGTGPDGTGTGTVTRGADPSTSVPEPGTLALLGLGLAGLGLARRKRAA
jgi:hypothetical protein